MSLRRRLSSICSSVVLFVLGTTLLLPATILGHVQLAYPPAIIDDDYQYTFDGSCQFNSCDAFCGSAGPSPVPVTTVSSGELLNVTLNVNVQHRPFRYRVALSSTGAGDAPSGFDTNVLLGDIKAPDDGSTEFTVTVKIPEDVKCNPYCSLQLFDYYYFVSCARIVLAYEYPDTGTSPDDNATSGDAFMETGGDGMDTGEASPPSVPSEVTFGHEVTSDGTIVVNSTVVLPSRSWFAIAVSQTGAMIGSQAIVGLPNATANDTTSGGKASVRQFVLDGKFTEAIKPILVETEQHHLMMSSGSSFNITEDGRGNYIHTLSVTLSADGACGMKLIWAHANPNGGVTPTDELGYHGSYRGVLGTIVECPPVLASQSDSTSPGSAGGDDDSSAITSTMEGRGQRGGAAGPASSLATSGASSFLSSGVSSCSIRIGVLVLLVVVGLNCFLAAA